MNTKYTFLLVFTIIGFTILAQVPGYLGQRLVVGYSNYFSLATAHTATTSDGEVSVNSTHCLNIDYVIKDHTNFCVSLQHLKTGVEAKNSFSYEKVGPFGDQERYPTYYTPNPDIPMQLRSFNLGIGFKFFGRKYIAPVGKYRKLELLFLFNRLTYDKDAFVYNDYGSGNKKATIGTGDYSYKHVALTYTLGRQRILFDKVILDIGTRMGFLINGATSLARATAFGYYFDDEDEVPEVLKSNVTERLFRHQFINFHVGIGFLAF